MAEPIVVIGAGGFGRETIDVVRAINAASPIPLWDLVGVVDDAPSDLNLSRLKSLGVTFLGRVESIVETPNVAVTIGIGSPPVRSRIAMQIDRLGLPSPDLVHPTAALGSQFISRGGLVACAHVSLGTNVSVGRHVHLNPHAVIGHDVIVEDCVSISPNATVSGDCVIGARTLLGAGSVVLQQLNVEDDCVIGASACVTKHVPANVTAVGIPAEIVERP